MIFYVYFDPDVIPTAERDGPFALQLLISTVRGFLQNCFVADFEDYRLQEAIGKKLSAMQPGFDRKKLKSVLAMLAKRNRFIYCLTPEYSGDVGNTQLLLEQAATAMIELALLSAEPPPETVVPDGLEVVTLSQYQHSAFEPQRSALAVNGKRTPPGEMTNSVFMDFHFRRAFAYATKIELCDRMFGRKYGDNYKYTMQQFLSWLEDVIRDPESCELAIHCEKPDGFKDDAIEQELRDGKRGRLERLKITVAYYDGTGLSDSLPHERFIVTDQAALSIDRGLDYLDRASHSNRDVYVSCTDPAECESLLSFYAPRRLGMPRDI